MCGKIRCQISQNSKKKLKDFYYFMRIHSKIILGKSLSAKRKELCDVMYFLNIIRRRLFEILIELRGDADKSLVWPTSRCRRTESIVSLERGVCSCAKLQVFSCYRGWKEACQGTRAISTTWRRELSSSFFFLQGKAPKEIHAFLTNIRGTCTIVCHRQNWLAQCKHRDFSTCDAPRPGRPKTVTTPEFIDQIHELILEDRRISVTLIAEQLDISRERDGSILHEYLDMRKFFAKWVPKYLSADQKRQRCQSSEQNLDFFRREPNDFLSRSFTMDET